MGNGANLLPDDLRDKEKEEKEKIKQNMGLPKLKWHLPEKQKALEIAKQKAARSERPEVSFTIGTPPLPPLVKMGIDKSEKNGVKPFPLKKETPKSITPFLPPPVKAPAAAVEKRPVFNAASEKERRMKMHLPEEKDADLSVGKQVLAETADKFEAIKKPMALAAFFHRTAQLLKFKKPPAEINLITEDYRQLVLREFSAKLGFLLLVALILLVIFAGLYIGFNFYYKKLADEYFKAAAAAERVSSEVEEYRAGQGQIENLRGRGQALEALLSTRTYWTEVLNKLEHNISANVVYTNFIAGNDGSIMLSAKAKSYKDVAGQLLIFEKSDFAAAVEINSVSQVVPEGKGAKNNWPVLFNVKFKLRKEISQ